VLRNSPTPDRAKDGGGCAIGDESTAGNVGIAPSLTLQGIPRYLGL
jgi:hypothetical protein